MKKQKRTSGITLIALVVTIIVLLLLAGISIMMLSGNNGLLNRATEAKEKTFVSKVKEQIQLEVAAMQIENEYYTTSDVIERIKIKRIINDDLTFTENSNYSLRYCGDIVKNGAILDNVCLTDNFDINSDINVPMILLEMVTISDRTIRCNDGIIRVNDNLEMFEIVANQPTDGKKFAYWVDKYNNIISYEESQELKTIIDNTYVAIYVDESVEINPNITINVYGSNQAEENKLAYNCCLHIPKNDNSIVSGEYGILATKYKNLANENELIVQTTNSDIYYKTSRTFAKTNNFFYWSKKDANDDRYYVRGWATLEYKDGSTKTIYTDIISEVKGENTWR